MRRYPKEVVAAVRMLHNQRRIALRQCKVAESLRSATQSHIDAFCAQHGITGRAFSRIARGLYGGAV